MTEETLSTLDSARAGREVTWKTIPQGAATSVWAGFVAEPDAVGGLYCEDCGVATVLAEPDPNATAGVYSYALDPESAKALWARSEELVGESFPD